MINCGIHNLIKAILRALPLVCIIFVNSCGDSDNSNPIDSNNEKEYSIKGYVQKGPFILGSRITIQELNNNLEPLGNLYEIETLDDFGNYELPNKVNNRYVEIIANGYYFNEITGSLSLAPLTLRAISDLSLVDSVNVNLLTTLTSKRIRHLLLNDNLSFQESKLISENEVLSVFNISDSTVQDFEYMDISKAGKQNAILLALSCILQSNQSEAELSELVSKMSLDIESDGLVSDSTLINTLRDNSNLLDLNKIRSNLQDRYNNLGVNIIIPEFEIYAKLLVKIMVVIINPSQNSVNVSLTPTISATFNKSMDSTSFNPSSFSITDGNNSILGTIVYNNLSRTVMFLPQNSLEFESSYYVKLSAQIRSSDGVALEEDYLWQFSTIKLQAPSSPEPLNNSQIIDTTPILNWGAVTGAFSYFVQISEESNFTGGNIFEVEDITTSNYQIISPFENNKLYFWRVKAKSSNSKWSDWSNTWSFSVKLPIVQNPIPGNYQNTHDTTPLLNWDDVANSVVYHLQVNDENNFDENLIINESNLIQSEYQIPTVLNDGLNYYWRVKSLNVDSIWSDWNESWRFEVKVPVPILISPSQNVSISDTLPVFDWSGVNEIRDYHFQLSSVNDFSTLLVNEEGLLNSEYHLQNSLLRGEQYFWRVKLKNLDNVYGQWATNSFYIYKLGEHWISATWNAQFAKRKAHTSLVYDNKIWVIGGETLNGSLSYNNDIWNSLDGINWNLVSNEADFGKRAYHTSVVHDNKMWVIGGYDGQSALADVWYSEDGVNWIQTTSSAAFGNRANHSSIVFNNKMWVIGGSGNAIYNSDDGIEWINVNANMQFVNRYYAVCKVFKNKILLIGGFENEYRNDVFQSEDGITWMQLNPNAAFEGRGRHACIVAEDKIYLMGGYNSGYYPTDVWASSDGAVWEEVISNAPFSSRANPTLENFSGKIWLVGGSFKNDVWYSE